ncbi:MAG: Re/Si-specific NAD(P)(+) transhydrogenase subunit alpha [bacterium]|nr:Re/Si-specific NAD(P)(+) transhydrogenase subunit alpha [bacterium]MCS7310030.1 Re/Si-specific NAD(P)(+) transhydrogenase subunit alpha [Armatimonadota bacterium]MDW8104933.1 Re/Si-specific NAD(P)(+) transhydrogenase subunit alpha [Armatimonadota bacterium]
MRIGVTQETFSGEARVALVPAAIAALRKAKAEVLVQAGAGKAAGFSDLEYADAGATVLPSREEVIRSAEMVLQVRALGANPDGWREDLSLAREGQVWIALMDPLWAPEPVAEAAEKGILAFALELVPRITRAQPMDVLSSQSNLAGYKAVLLAANALTKIFPMMMTAAGTITPARVFVIGAGVAGLQAIATARRLGAVVSAYDVRPAVREQVESLGARFVELPLEAQDAQDASGYARALGEEFYRRQAELMKDVLPENDVVITTAAVPGQRAPVLITREMVEGMRPGSVIVDLAAERGGNCELTQPGQTIVHQGVTIIGPLNLPATMPYHASQLFAKNISSFALNLLKDGELHLNLEDQILSETLLTRDGQVVHPRVRERLGLSA